VQEVRPAGGGAVAEALWRENQSRMARMIGALRTGAPEPDIARHDRHALRAVPLLLVAIAFAFSYSNRGGLLTDVVKIADQLLPAGLVGNTQDRSGAREEYFSEEIRWGVP